MHEKFHDDTARNNVSRLSLPFWFPIAHPEPILGMG